MSLLPSMLAAPAWAVGITVLAYDMLIVVLACTATFARSPRLRRDALTVLRVLVPGRRG